MCEPHPVRAALVLVLPLAACFTKPDLVAGTPLADAPGADVPVDGSPGCLFDSFDMGLSACRPWGTGFGNAVFSTMNGDLKLSLDGPVDGGCFSNAPLPFTEGGFAMEIAEIPQTATGYVNLVAYDSATNPMIAVQDGMIRLTNEPRNDYVAKPYDPVKMRWLRLRPDRPGGNYIGDTSPDGVTWTRLGNTSGLGPPAEEVVVKLEAGVQMVGAPPTQARIAELQVCRP